jgi:hypothetical protein
MAMLLRIRNASPLGELLVAGHGADRTGRIPASDAIELSGLNRLEP